LGGRIGRRIEEERLGGEEDRSEEEERGR